MRGRTADPARAAGESQRTSRLQRPSRPEARKRCPATRRMPSEMSTPDTYPALHCLREAGERVPCPIADFEHLLAWLSIQQAKTRLARGAFVRVGETVVDAADSRVERAGSLDVL